MTELIEKLRGLERMFCANRCEEPSENGLYRMWFGADQLDAHEDTCEKAAVEIERLQEAKRAALKVADERSKENVRLRAELQKIAGDEKNCAEYCRRQARRALSRPGG